MDSNSRQKNFQKRSTVYDKKLCHIFSWHNQLLSPCKYPVSVFNRTDVQAICSISELLSYEHHYLLSSISASLGKPVLEHGLDANLISSLIQHQSQCKSNTQSDPGPLHSDLRLSLDSNSDIGRAQSIWLQSQFHSNSRLISLKFWFWRWVIMQATYHTESNSNRQLSLQSMNRHSAPFKVGSGFIMLLQISRLHRKHLYSDLSSLLPLLDPPYVTTSSHIRIIRTPFSDGPNIRAGIHFSAYYFYQEQSHYQSRLSSCHGPDCSNCIDCTCT